MATQNGRVNKSQAIRDYIAKNPNATTREVVTALKAKGIRTQDSLVYMIRGKAKRKQKRERRQQAVASVRITTTDPVALVVRVRELANDAGGLGPLKQLVEAMGG